MRIAVISDVHANLDAPQAVLADIRRSGVPHVVCLGDLVGYSMFPRETLTLLREHKIRSVHGDHDLMAIGRLPIKWCSPIARRALAWTSDVLTQQDRCYLAGLPGELRHQGNLLFVHSALGDLVIELELPEHFHEQFLALNDDDPELEIYFTGHTHRQLAVQVTRHGEVIQRTAQLVALSQDSFWFVNPGSVGLPQGRDVRAGYAIYDLDARTVELRRVAYERTQLERRDLAVLLNVG